MMPENIDKKGDTLNVSVAELECYLNGLQCRFEAKSSFAILKICFTRLKDLYSDPKVILGEMLHFFEATQPENIQQNEIYMELLNLFDQLFCPGPQSLRRIPALPLMAADNDKNLDDITAADISGTHEFMKPTIRPREFGGVAMTPFTRNDSSQGDRSAAETMRPSQDPGLAEPENEGEDFNERVTMLDLERTQIALNTASVVEEDAFPGANPVSEMPEIETGEADAADLGLPEEKNGDGEGARDSENPGST